MPRKRESAGLPEQLADLTFPTAGLDLTAEFELQRPGTTPTGENVRVYEALTQRGRGGSRPGLAKYVAEQVADSVIQHLNYIVDPNADALSTAFDPLDTPIVPLGLGWGFGPGPFPDYGFPVIVAPTPNPAITPGEGGILLPSGYYIRTGGSGVQLNKNIGTVSTKPPPPPPAPLTLTITWDNGGFVLDFSNWITAHSDGMHDSFHGTTLWSDPSNGFASYAVTGGSAGPYTISTLTAVSDGFDIGDMPTVDTPDTYDVTISGAGGTGLSQFGTIAYVNGTFTRTLG